MKQEEWGGGAPEQKAQKKFLAFHIVIRHSSSIPERFPREDYKTNELSVKLVANSNVSKILFVFKSKNNFRQRFISIEKKINEQITISMGIQGPAIGIPVVVVDMNETELKSRKPRVLKSSPFSRFFSTCLSDSKKTCPYLKTN